MTMNFSEKVQELKEKVLQDIHSNKNQYIVFVSISNGQKRAVVVNAKANTLEAAFDKAIKLAKPQAALSGKNCWVKVDVVTDIEKKDYQDFLNEVTNIKFNYFRKGISFDGNFSLAFLEQEVNANSFLQGIKQDIPNAKFNFNNINFYLNKIKKIKKIVEEKRIQSIYVFNTVGYFHDGEQLQVLGTNWLNHGHRIIENIDKKLLTNVIEGSSSFLANQVDSNGKFRYGYFPNFNKEINTYNILRHASTTYSMIEAYELSPNEELKAAIERAIRYLINDTIKVVDSYGKVQAFVIEEVADNEIKLGANAHAILALSKYTTVFNDKQYKSLMQKLAEGILRFQNKDTGAFKHVLYYPTLVVKEDFRTIYYDGEATFALMRLYEIDQDEKWLNAVKLAFDHFLKNDYWKYGDHWLSYASNELFKYVPDKTYAEMNLKNAGRRLDFCLTRETAFPTLLELLMASYKLITYMKENSLHLDLLDEFDEEKLHRAIDHRVKHQLNSYFWPEFAMYYKVPKNILNSFYIRHHSFRVRIDDIEHNISGYCSFIHNVKEVLIYK